MLEHCAPIPQVGPLAMLKQGTGNLLICCRTHVQPRMYNMNMKLKDKLAIVTGGASGMGQAIAKAMAGEGALTVVADIAEQEGQDVVKEINNAGGQAIYIKVNVSSANEIKKAVRKILRKYGKIDILVNDAGIARIESFLESDGKRWDKVIDVNLKGTILFCHAVLPAMVERKNGKIINISSNSAIVAHKGHAVYSASKGGVNAFTRTLATEVACYHINVNCICPGVIDTPMVARGRTLYPDYMERLTDDIPWGRLGRPEDIARAAVFLASDDSEYITGQCILVDGGISKV